MPALSEEGRTRLSEIASRHGVSFDVVEHLLMAVLAGQGTQAQFNHPDLGGMGQWSQGGMTMIGDMFNNGLKAQVDSLCRELSDLIRSSGFQAESSHQSQSQMQGGYGTGHSTAGVSLFVPGGATSSNWWPKNLGPPSSVGAQNNMRYALFPASHRLAIDLGGNVTLYDTGDHQIGGFSQQQSGDQSLTFTSQYGLVRVADLTVVTASANESASTEAEPISPPVPAVAAPVHDEPARAVFKTQANEVARSPANSNAEDDIFAKIERLADLHAKGILTDAEYSDKKAELLSRL